MFDNHIFNEFNEFRKSIESQIEVKSSNYNGEYNRFKKCPHCGIIWFKIKGCDSVVCGKRTKAEDKIIGKYKKYTVTYVDNKVVISIQDIGEDAKMINNLMMNQMRSYNNISENNQMNNPMISNNNISQNNQIYNSMTINNNNNPMMNMMSNNNNMSQNNRMYNSMTLNNNNNLMMNMMSNNNNNPMMNMISNNNNSPNDQMMMNMMSMMNMNYQNEDEFVGLTKKENLENLQREKEGKIKIQPFGCGRSLNWKDMEDVSDEVILKLKEISIDDYHAGFLKISEKINN